MPPASTVTSDSFLESIRNSRLTGEENIRTAIANVSQDSVEEIAAALVRKNILNEWQAKYLLAGQPGLRIGNYILKGRVGQDSLGERFFAVQESLSRTVDLQLLPESLVAEQSGMDRFLESASQLTHLDHHAIVHLYDVADHQGRPFIVSEHCVPMTESEFRAIPDSGLAHLRAVRDMCEGIRYLHEHDLSHGFLGAENSIRLAQPGVVKLDRLAWSVLQRELVSRSLIETFEQRRTADWQQIGNFAGKLLVSAPIDKALSQPNRDSLVGAFKSLATSSEPETRAKLLSDKISELIGKIEKRPTPAVSQATIAANGAVEKPATFDAPAKASPFVAASTAQPKPVPATSSAKPRKAPAIPAARSAIPKIVSIVSIIALACVVGWFAWGKFGPKASGETAQRETKTSNTGRSGRSGTSKPAKPKTAVQPDIENSSESEIIAAEIKKDPTDDDSSVALKTATDSPAASELTTAAADKPSVPKLVPDPPVPAVPSPDEKRTTPAETTQPPAKLLDPTGTQDSKPETETVAPNAEVVETMPASFALLDGTHHEPQEIGTLPGGPAGEVTVSLEYDPETNGRGKNWFALQASGHKWKLAWSKKSANEELENVANLELDANGKLVFQWNDSIDDKHPANCFVNSAIRINAGGRIYKTWMRETISFDAPALDADRLESTLKMEIPWMPNSDKVTIEFGELLADRGWTEEAMLENDKFENKEPARIFFRSLPEERLLWLAMDGRVRGKVELELTVQTVVAGRMTNMKRHELDLFVNAYRANHEALVVRENQAQIAADNAVTGFKTKTKEAAKEARKDTEAGKAQRDLAFEYLGWIEGLIGKPVPIRVMYQVGEQSIELARSSGWEVPPAPATETPKD